MKSLIFQCKACNRYTLYPTCPNCGGTTLQPIPPRFSPEDKYGKYRRQLKKEMELKEIKE
jgi:H/ACA ribonucleoprotein complex subunit 3